jgi:hypothetical protein
MERTIVHLSLHALVPALVAWLFFRPRWRRAWIVMLLTMLVDADHLLASPIFDPGRCSIGFHPLHTAPAIAVYAGLVPFRRTRAAGLGLLIHMILDGVDCLWMRG